MKYSSAFIIIILFITLNTFSCTDKLPKPPLDCSTTFITYDNDIKNILDATCNVADCHDDNTQSSFGDYSSLDASRMNSIATNVKMGLMPPSGDITSGAADTIRCWMENGFLQN